RASDIYQTLSRYYYRPEGHYNYHCVAYVVYHGHRSAQNVARHSARYHSHKNGYVYIHFDHAETHKYVSLQIRGVPPKPRYRHCRASVAWLRSVRVQTARIFQSGWPDHEKF